jgi:hypothetical protein
MRRKAMGPAYRAKRPIEGCEDFQTSFSGEELLGWLHKWLELPVCTHHYDDADYHYIKGDTTAAECRVWSEMLAAKPDEAVKAFLEKHTDLIGQSPAEMVVWVRAWQKFLATCGGYEEDG